jgi:hypothetical protein
LTGNVAEKLYGDAAAFDDRFIMIEERVMGEERRMRRSESPEKALAMFLESSRKRLGVHALTVATSEGRLVAGSGDGALLVAALGAKVDAGEMRKDERVAVWSLSIGTKRYVIASLGSVFSAEVGDGVRRILS